MSERKAPERHACVVIFNAPGHLCLRPNLARDDGLWPGGPFWMVGDAIYFHRQDALAAVALAQAG